MSDNEKHIYPEQKVRDLTEAEKAQIRARLEEPGADTYKIAADFGCSSSQVAAIKAHLKR